MKPQPLSEEDEQLKKTLEDIVTALADPSPTVQKSAIDQLRNQLKDTTSTVTSIPKPLKFLKPHYDTIKQTFYDRMVAVTNEENKTQLATLLSVMAMTMGKEDERDSLRFILLGDVDEFDQWGHEYVSSLAGEVGAEYQHRWNENPDLRDDEVIDLLTLVNKIVPYFIKCHAEPEACDLLLETEKLEQIIDFCEQSNVHRICPYLMSVSKFTLEPEDAQIQRIVYNMYYKLQKFPESLRVALQLNDRALINQSFKTCADSLTRKQMAFMLGRHNTKVNLDGSDEAEDGEGEEDMMSGGGGGGGDVEKLPIVELDEEEQELLMDLMGNNKLSEHFMHLAKELDSLAPKTPEDIYKSHLTEVRSTLAQNVDSARQNLASTLVNAFVNAASGTDKLMTEEGNKWLYKNKDHAMMSAAASLGMLYMWNQDDGLGELDKYMYSGEDYIKGGALLGIGIVNASLRNNTDAAFALLSEHVEGSKRDVRIGAILGLGIAYAGTCHEDVNELLVPILVDGEQSIEIVALVALTLGLVFVGSGNEDITEAIMSVLSTREEKDLTHPLARYLSLALGFLFLGKGEAAEFAIEAAKILSPKIAQSCELTIDTCAYAGSGNVLKVQQLLKICGEHIEEGKENAHQGIAAVGIAMIALGEELGADMAIRSFDHLLQYSDLPVKRAVPLAIGLLNVSNPKMTIMDTLSKLSHDADAEVSQGAILGLGLIGAGSNNARIAQLLRQLASYYAKEPNHLLMVRIAQGLLFMGKGLISMSPLYSDRSLMHPASLCGLLTVIFASLDLKSTILAQYHYLLYTLTCSMFPRMLITVDEDLNPLAVSVRVGTAVDTVAQAGRPKTITGFQTHNTPVILQYDDRAELATEEYIPLSPILEGVVILKKNPDWQE